MTGLAHSDHDHPPTAFKQNTAGFRKGIIDTLLKSGDGLCLQADDLPSFADEFIFCHGLRGCFPSRMMCIAGIVAERGMLGLWEWITT
jgi:hypothetical protein